MASYDDKGGFEGKMISQKMAKLIYKASDHYEIPAGTIFKLKGEIPGVAYIFDEETVSLLIVKIFICNG